MLDAIEMKDMIAREVLAHLCSPGCHGFGEAIEMCETRGDCVIVITCPNCRKSYTLDDDQYEMLAYAFAGTTVWVLCSVGLWALVHERFARVSRRSGGSLKPDRRGGERVRRPRRREPEDDDASRRSTAIRRREDRLRERTDADGPDVRLRKKDDDDG